MKIRRIPNKLYSPESPRTFYDDARNDMQRNVLSTGYLAEPSSCNNVGSGSPRASAGNSYEKPNNVVEGSRRNLYDERPNERDFGYCERYSEGLSVHGMFPYPLKCKLETKKQRSRTPEVLLAPHYLDGCGRQACCHWGPPYK